MSDLRELYQEVILDHNKSPRNFRKIETASRKAEGLNPLCGDEVTVYLSMEGDVIADIAFEGQGCAISKASASMMTLGIKGRTTAEAERLFEEVHQMLAGDGEVAPDPERLGRLTALAGVRDYPMRVKCATLAWHTLRGALWGDREIIFSE